MSLIITGVLDGPLSGGLPKAVELFVTADIADLSSYGLGSANNGGGSDGEEFTFPAVAVTAGSYIYVASETAGFTEFMGFAPDYTAGALSVNGDDAIELYAFGSVIDLFGDINVDGNGQPWEYLDGWAARNPGATASSTFDVADWTLSGANAFDGQTSNATAATPFPTGSFENVVTAPTFVINEIDADQDSTDSQEFIEIYDGGVGNASLDGLTLVLFNGNGEASYDTISLDGFTTNADGFFVVGSADVPNVDLVEFTTNGLQNGADAVALYEGAAPTAATTVNLVDAIVYGTNDADDTELLAALGQSVQANESANGTSTSDALARQPDETGDFVAQAPTPGASNFIEPPAEITLISEIQGSVGTGDLDVIGVDDRSALEGQIVTVSAIVTADFQDGLFGTQGDLNGFYIQEEEIDYDFNDLSSEGIFIFDGTAPLVDVNIGDLVEITGSVSEFFGQTQLSATSVVVMDTDQPIPPAMDVVFPTANIMDDGSGNYVANLEAYEGMLVNVAQDMTVSEMFNLDRFGQYNVTADGRVTQFTQNNDPDAEGYEQHLQDTAARTLVLDDGLSAQNPDTLEIIDGNDGVLTADDSFRMGDEISSIEGVVGYSFGEFRINDATGVYDQTNPRDETPEDIGGNFTVASLNVLNYFTTIDETGVTTDNGSDPRGADSLEEFERQADKLVKAIVAIDADVLGLIEIENDFAGDTFAIKDIVERVNADLGSEIYAFADPKQEFVGGDAISNGLIYKVNDVGLKGDMAILETFNGQSFLDPLGAGRDLNRPAIAQTFEDLDTGQTLTVSVNHLKSKGSLSGLAEDEAQGDGQGNNNATRTEAASILAQWLKDDPTGQGSENTLILGDLNAYAKEDPLTTLSDAGFTDLAATELGDDAYSYVFDGQVGTLDYALANDALAENLAGVTEWHINSDEADALDYNLDFGRDPTLYSDDSPARNSDHDPVIVSFDFDPVYNLVAGTNRRDFLYGTEGRDQIDGMSGNDFIFAAGGDDLIFGGSGNDKIFAGSGHDDIDAGSGNDFVFAGDGDDVIRAGDGKNDKYWGGDGADTFIFSAELAEDRTRDKSTVYDFNVLEDVIDLGGAVVDDVREHWGSVRITLEGGNDRITLLGVSDFDDIVFADQFTIA
ncbi:ExeM/NucH family extracellular endonuclease [Octadecabacter sp. 1_MG-2023]|uniref:ExeM/NucH family extracellular endonuclease n=1 Tax=unclassified Octadecabacter TaxID=196158 RepID=UPI001C094606|nr:MULTISPECIES: ExeM/NucH family extracellular endonuclease [unclassified Octadecabacter]MBU2993318.1 ExeM/NucH family extracellular endonuclease [Octadecabacter sp. B2R22]MDO6733226.1 ExeM/NucH family extracellular endonuclease [Octadecabacter sp. 1_MG-2023]